MRLKRFSGFTLIKNANILILNSEESIRTETVEEMYKQKGHNKIAKSILIH